MKYREAAEAWAKKAYDWVNVEYEVRPVNLPAELIELKDEGVLT
jgi:hypothetical protein